MSFGLVLVLDFVVDLVFDLVFLLNFVHIALLLFVVVALFLLALSCLRRQVLLGVFHSSIPLLFSSTRFAFECLLLLDKDFDIQVVVALDYYTCGASAMFECIYLHTKNAMEVGSETGVEIELPALREGTETR